MLFAELEGDLQLRRSERQLEQPVVDLDCYHQMVRRGWVLCLERLQMHQLRGR